MKIREYRGPLTVLASGAVGFSLFCIVAAAALTDPKAREAAAMQPQDIVDSAISNINTVAALTYESIVEFIPTATPSPSNTISPTETDVPTNTATLLPTRTRIPPTNTRERSGRLPTFTSTHPPTQTFTPVPTDTPEPTFTDTLEPTITDTPEPPPTDTPEPPPTDTPEPPPTDTSVPAATNPADAASTPGSS